MAEGADMARVERQPGFLHRTSTKIALAGSGLVLAAAGAIGVKTGLEKGGSSPENSNPAVVLPVIPQPTEGPKLATPIPSLTPEATHTPTATSTPGANPDAKFPPPEIKQEVPCLVVDQQFCSQAERVMVTLSSGAQFGYIGFRDLPPGTPVYAPVDGFFRTSRESGPQSPVSGFSLTMPSGDSGTIVKGYLELNSVIQRDMKSGELIGRTTGTKTLGEYDILITSSKRSADGPVVDEDALRKLFPAAFEKPAKSAKQVLQPSVTVSYESTPPR